MIIAGVIDEVPKPLDDLRISIEAIVGGVGLPICKRDQRFQSTSSRFGRQALKTADRLRMSASQKVAAPYLICQCSYIHMTAPVEITAESTPVTKIDRWDVWQRSRQSSCRATAYPMPAWVPRPKADGSLCMTVLLCTVTRSYLELMCVKHLEKRTRDELVEALEEDRQLRADRLGRSQLCQSLCIIMLVRFGDLHAHA